MSNAEKLYAQHEELKFNAPPLDIPLSQGLPLIRTIFELQSKFR